MKEKLPFTDEIFNHSEVIYLESFDSNAWRNLKERFPNVITANRCNAFEEELSRFQFNFKNISSRHILSEKSIIYTWNKLSKDYTNLARLAKALMVLPYTTAPVESTFSMFKVFKDPYRNKLSYQGLEASLLIEQASGTNTVIITPDMIEKYEKLWENPEEIKVDETMQSITKPSNNWNEHDVRSIHSNIALISDFLTFIQTHQALAIDHSQSQPIEVPSSKNNEDNFGITLTQYAPRSGSLKRTPDRFLENKSNTFQKKEDSPQDEFNESNPFQKRKASSEDKYFE